MRHERIQPFAKNRAYWQYQGQPTLLLGGSVEDNPFQLPEKAAEAAKSEHLGEGVGNSPDEFNLVYQLETLRAVGGNFIRCTMSCRDQGDVWPYCVDPQSGLYDLNLEEPEFWRRFERFLTLTQDRGIIVQVELWATYDFYEREVRPGFFPWRHNPYNPANNVNYGVEESGLPVELHSDGCCRLNPFFETVPELNDNRLLLGFQKAYVDRLLEIAFGYDHVLYCMDNETNAHPAWAAYWARYVRQRAKEARVEVETTEMWDSFDPTDGAVEGVARQPEETNPFVRRATPLNCLDHPELYTFFDISNHNAQRGETHYRTALWFRNKVHETGPVRPVHCDKMYGGDSGLDFAGTRRDGLERFWRNIFGGLAGCRFHRPPAGLGIDPEAQAHIRSMRMLTDALDIFTCNPRPDLFTERVENGAFCLADPGRAYAVVFLKKESCVLDLSAMNGKPASLHWLHIATATWHEPKSVKPCPFFSLKPPDGALWVGLIQ